ncbi:MAG TPA: hypothetical protein VKU19_35375 [Bryobacteraceae bacterium]|nr:hypothetical protein [Bryobacteraceae bacterium]
MDLNLDTLKQEILEYLSASGFAVFHSTPGGLNGLPMVLWDTERFPDYQMFLEVARQSGVKLILFAAQEFEVSDVDELLTQLDDCELTRDEKREYESRLRDLRIFTGVTCSLEIAFDYQSRLYIYEVQPDWYEDFQSIEDEIATRLAEDDGSMDDDSLGGYYSKN